MTYRVVWAAFLACWLGGSAVGAEIGFPEDFALAKAREEALKKLVPGSEDYYYYHCLHLLNQQQFDRIGGYLTPWLERYGRTPRVLEIQLRHALLTYERHPEQSLEFLRQHLGLEFQHQRQILGEKPNLPGRLDQQLIDRDRLKQLALQRHANLDGFEDAALDWLAGLPWDPDRRRILLQRLQRPDYANLPQLVVDDLDHPNSPGFGGYTIHGQLLLAQLDECLRLKPDLLNQQNFVNIYLSKLQPSPDANWRYDAAERAKYLDRLWAFVSRLAPVHNSLKAHVLYQRLAHDRSQGGYDKQRFLAYLQLPRQVPYLARTFVEQTANRFAADLNADFSSLTLFPPIRADEPLVRAYLQHFFLEENSIKPYEPFVQDVYLKEVFAETKLVHGLGNAEQWYSWLSPEQLQALQERIDIDFSATNREQFAAEEPVSIDVHVKNVRTLLIKVFEINTRNYYREHLREVNTDINLDGLVANEERTIEYNESPLRRIERHFEFPALTRPGVYVIDLIGNGMSSRVVVRKGKLRHLVRTTTAGHVFTILDENNKQVKDAALWLQGREFTPDEEGRIAVPFSDAPAQQTVILSRGNLSSLESFSHESESYSLQAGICVDREALLARRDAEVIVRPGLYLNGHTLVGVKVLEDVRLRITSTDLDGIVTTKEVSPFKLFEDRESSYTFQTPRRVENITFTLTAKVQNLSQNNKKVDLEASQTFTLNSIDKSDKVEDVHLMHVESGYVLELLGKTGEPKADRPVQIQLKHRDFREAVVVTLKTDGRGRLDLGALDGIVSIVATGPAGIAHTWPIDRDQHSYPATLHGRSGEPLTIPFMGSQTAEDQKPEVARREVSLLELRGETFVTDHFDRIRIDRGALVLNGLPPGDYDLWLKGVDRRIRVRLTEGELKHRHVLGETRLLEVRDQEPVQISHVDVQKDKIRIQLANAGKFSRVHVVATRYVPTYDPFGHLGRVVDGEPGWQLPAKAQSVYVTGRNIGDEYRYILERKYARKYPGMMLERPSLLLNPWAVRSTSTGQQQAQEGTAFAPAAPAPQPAPGRSEAPSAAGIASMPAPLTSNLDFLGESSVVITNLEADEKGVVTIDRDDLGAHHLVQIVAVAPRSTAYRRVALPAVESKRIDLRLARGLDVEKDFTQQKRISIVKAQDKFVVADIVTSKFEIFDDLSDVYRLYITLSRDPQLVEFGFLLRWPELKPEEQRAMYSKYASHELNFFLFKKDPMFFNGVIKPYLANKRHPTFLDHWLLGHPLENYLLPWNYEQLNVVERVLLMQRVAGDRENGKRHIHDLYQLIPPELDRFNTLFRTAIRGSGLETSDEYGVNEALNTAIPEVELLGKLTRNLNADSYRFAAPGAAGEAREAPPSDAPKAEDPRPRDQEERGAVDRKQSLTKESKDKAAALRQRVAGRRLTEESLAAPKDSLYFSDVAEFEKRKEIRQFFQQLDKTQEWAENNYYKITIDQQVADRVKVSGFWDEYASHDVNSNRPFLSSHLAETTSNLTEMLFALAVLDLPFSAEKHESQIAQTSFTLTAASPMVVFHEEIRETAKRAEGTPVLVSQNFFQAHDRYRMENNERLDKFVADEFLVHTVYGCQVVITNPTSTPQKLDVLTQIPMGSLPVSGGEATRSIHIQLAPFSTQTVEYYFYFPGPGTYAHYPVHVAKNEELLAHPAAFTFKVVEELTHIDKASWDYVSQHGTDDQVLEFLNKANLHQIDLERIAFRMQNAEFFRKITSILASRHVYHHTLWSYGIKHNDVPTIREFLQHNPNLIAQTGEVLDSPLLTIDPVARRTFEHLEYLPLVNARTHPLGRRRQILNDRFFEQYHRLMKILGYQRELHDTDKLAVTYYLLLQDRNEEAGRFFAEINAERLNTRLQYDYFAAYFALLGEDLDAADQIAGRYLEHPVDRWRNTFRLVRNQIAEARGDAPDVLDQENRGEVQGQLASTDPTFEFEVKAEKVTIRYQNLDRVNVNFYLMDVELLFSRTPFVEARGGGQFAHIRPNLTRSQDLPKKAQTLTFDLPKELQNRNVLVEISAAGQTKSQPYYANSLSVQVIENYGQLKVQTANPAEPLPKVYVKTYARLKDGSIRFFKDGYTDLRGRFDYASLSTNELEQVDRFALLILSEEHGAVVREAAPPQR